MAQHSSGDMRAIHEGFASFRSGMILADLEALALAQPGDIIPMRPLLPWLAWAAPETFEHGAGI